MLTTKDKDFIANYVNPDFHYVTRDKDGMLCLWKDRPVKGDYDFWTSRNDNCRLIDGAIVFKHLFPYVTWEDEKPTIINSLLDKKEKYFIKHYILNNPCFRKMKVNFIRKCLYDAHNSGMCLEVEFDNHDFSYTNIPMPDGMFENLKLGIMYSVDEILI